MGGFFVVIAFVEFGVVAFLVFTIMNRHDRMRDARKYARAIAIRTPDKEVKGLAELIDRALDIHREER